MSYILDAIRKSEHERQIAAGQSVGMLYPIELQRERKLWIPMGIIVLITTVTVALIWWLWMQPPPPTVTQAAGKPSSEPISQSSVTIVEVDPEPTRSQMQKTSPEKKPVSAPEQKKAHATAIASIIKTGPIQSEQPAKTTTTTNQSAGADPLKDMPALRITGFIHNAESGNLAMINNQLVHEGDEVSPGLRLVKILDNSAIFSYKGFVFSR